jgi:DNA-binding CsgD family transcriptional regulator
MGQLDQLHLAIRRIYEAASDFHLWPAALSAIEEVTGSVGAVIDFVPRGHFEPLTLAGRFTAEQCATYSREYQSICRRIKFAIEHPEIAVACDDMHITEAEMDRDPVYSWLGKHDLRYYLGGHLAPTNSHYVYCSVQRSPRQGHAQAPDIELFGALKDHMSQAVALAARLGTLASTSSITLGMLDTLPHAIFAVGSHADILFANASGQALLRGNDGVASTGGKLWFADPDRQKHLEQLIEGIAERNGKGGWLRIDRPSGRRPYAALVSRLELPRTELPNSHACAVVVVHEPERALAIDLNVLRLLYDLTEAETRLAAALADGHSLASAAADLRISLETARVHLKAVFRKTRTNRQQDLIRLLATLT